MSALERSLIAFRSLYRSRFALAMLMPLSISVGCHQPLAVGDAYFRPGPLPDAAHNAEVLRAVRYHRALQTARRSCTAAAPGSANGRTGPDFGAALARSALADLCAEWRNPSTAALGGTANAYRRWVEDRIRELPEATATAAGPAGGT